MKVLSIVIGTDCTKVCEISYLRYYKKKGVRVYRSLTFPTPPNTIEDGYIRNREAFGELLKNKLKEGKFKSDKVIFSVTSSKIANREVILPPVKEKRIMEIIKTGATEYFPIDMKDYILSYSILEKNTSNQKEKAKKKKQRDEKLTNKLGLQHWRAQKRKSKTERIADSMELMLAKQRELPAKAAEQENKNESITDKAKRSMRLSVYAAPSTLVMNYYHFAKLMHFDIVAIDYSGNSSYQAIKRQAKAGTKVFVQMNQKDSLISILRDDVLILQRTVGYGLSTMLEAVMEQEYFHVKTQEEALKLIENRNLLIMEPKKPEVPRDDSLKQASSRMEEEAAAADEYKAFPSPVPQPDERELEARRNIRDSLHFLANSIARMLDYYKSSHKEIDIDTIYLTGSGVHIQGIENFFTSEIGITHKNMEKLISFSSNKTAEVYRKNPSDYITCMGAVINPVDFVPLEYTLKKQKRSAIIGTLVFTMACLAGSAGTVYVARDDYMAAKKELKAVNEQLNRLPELSGVHEALEIAEKELANLQELEKYTQSNNDTIPHVIAELEKKLPNGTVIHSMQFTEAAVTMSVTASVGEVNPNALVAVILKQLKTIEYFRDQVEITGITVTEQDGVSYVSFNILCTYVE